MERLRKTASLVPAREAELRRAQEVLAAADGAAPAVFEPNVWLRIGPDGVVTIIVARSELGQGSQTSMAMLVAETSNITGKGRARRCS